MAVGHAVLLIAYRLLRDAGTYEDLGPLCFEEGDREALVRALVRGLERLGHKAHPGAGRVRRLASLFRARALGDEAEANPVSEQE